MKWDVFFSISQTPVDGHTPTEAQMFRHFFDQVQAADHLGFGVAWVAESHLSTEVQKGNRAPVVPHWQGEIGLNANLPTLAAYVFARTKRIEVGAAVMNIVTMGGPIAAAEKIASMLALHGLDPAEQRRLHIGFSAGRFAFMNEATGIVPRNDVEEAAWPALRGRIFDEAVEIFVRLLRGEVLSSDDVAPTELTEASFWVTATCGACARIWDVPFAVRDKVSCRACGSTDVTWSPDAWDRLKAVVGDVDAVTIDNRWVFERLKIVPADWRRELLQLVIGSHDPTIQARANTWAPVQVFNLSITQPEVIERTHARMAKAYHPDGGPWQRSYMPRTVMVFVDADPERSPEQQRHAAQQRAKAALEAYWTALEGTLDPRKIEAASNNALIGNPQDVAAQIRERFHPDDRLMLWFDFFDHDSPRVIRGMTAFMEHVVPLVEGR